MFETSDSRSSLSGSTQFVSSFCWRVLKSWYSSLSGIVGKMFCHSFHSTKQVWEFYFDNLVFTVFAFRQMCHSTIDTESCCRVRSQGSTVSKFIDKYPLIILCPVHIIGFPFSLKTIINYCSKLIISPSNFLGQFPWTVFYWSCYSESKLKFEEITFTRRLATVSGCSTTALSTRRVCFALVGLTILYR